MNRLAFSTLGCPDWSVARVVEAAREYGYDGVELRLIDGEIIEPSIARQERQRVKEAFAAAGLPICCVDTSIRVAADEPSACVANVRAFLELAHEWQSPVVRVFAGPWRAGLSENAVYDAVAAVLNQVVGDAERLGVTIALETHDSLSSARQVAEIARRVPSRGFGVLWDCHHPYRMGEQPDEVVGLLGDRIAHFHVKDARPNPAARTGWDLLLLGEGEVPVRDSLVALIGSGYDGWVCVEWEKKWHPDIPDPAIAFPQHAQLLRRWMGEIDARRR